MRAIDLNHSVQLSVVKDTFSLPVDLRKEDEAAQDLLNKMTSFVLTLDDDYLNVEPWFIFHAWLDYRFEPFAKCHNIFRAWQLFHWLPDPTTVREHIFDTETNTIAAAYLKSNSKSLTAEEIRLLKQAQTEQLDLYEVIAAKDSQLILFGLINRRKIHAYHPTLGERASAGEYLLASAVLAHEETHILLGASDLLPIDSMPQVREFCDFIDRCDPSTPRVFKSFESDVFNLFYDLTQDA